jgi:hypothetical protein
MEGVRDKDSGAVPGGVGEPSRLLNPRLSATAKTALFWIAWLVSCAALGYGLITLDAGMIVTGGVLVVVSGWALARRLR